MTRDEKIKAAIDSLTREQKLERMRESVWDWDMTSLVEAAFSPIEARLENIIQEDFDDEYYEWFASEFEDSKYDDDEEPDPVLKEKCECNLDEVYWRGHDSDCPDCPTSGDTQCQ
jgi:hypothetical protein